MKQLLKLIEKSKYFNQIQFIEDFEPAIILLEIGEERIIQDFMQAL